MNSDEPPIGASANYDGASGSRQTFEVAVADLDLATSNRLRLMRRAALTRQPVTRRRWLLPAATSATAALALGLAWWSPSLPQPAVSPVPAPSQSEGLLLDNDEDAELYAWLGEAPVAVEQAKAGPL